MREFEEQLVRQEQDLNQKAVDLQKQKDELERQQDQLNAQKIELQQVTELILLPSFFLHVPIALVEQVKVYLESF